MSILKVSQTDDITQSREYKEHLRQYLKLRLESSQLLFSDYMFKAQGSKFLPSAHHRKIEKVLLALEKGELYNEDGERCTFVVINIAPRFGKTQFVCIDWVARCIAINPAAKFIHLSYSDELAVDNSSKCRDLINSYEYGALWGVELKKDTDSKKKWYTTEGGGMYATGAGGQVTGFGAGSLMSQEDGKFHGAIIIDDPLKVDDAGSVIERTKVNDRLINTIMSRRNSRNTPIVLIGQRLHEDDMSGFVLAGNTGMPIYHLKLPALQETPGYEHLPIDDPNRYQSLWEYKYTVQELLNLRRVNRAVFATQFQQDPAPEEGTFFSIKKINRFRLGEEPTNLIKYGAGDFAVTADDGDYTELGIAGFDHKEDLYLLDWFTGRVRLDESIKALHQLHKDHQPMLWAFEKGVIRRASEPFIEQSQRIHHQYFTITWLPATASKAVNAKSFQGLVEQGKVYIPFGSWGDSIIEQLSKFCGYKSKIDDKVDVCGIFGRILGIAHAPSVYRAQEEPEKKAFDYGFGDEDEEYNTGSKIPVI